MDWAAIQAQQRAAREIEAPAGGHSFTLRVPTRHEVNVAVARLLVANGDGSVALLQRKLLELAIVGWNGPRMRDLLPASDDATPLPCEPAAVPLLLDEQPELEDELGAALNRAFAARRERAEDIAGN